MGGRGARAGTGGGGGGGGRQGKASGVDPANIVSTTDLVSMREQNQHLVDQALQAFQDAYNDYGYLVDQIQIAELKGKARQSTMAYYDGANIAVNKAFFNKALADAYDKCVSLGFHPSRGNKSAMEALMSHEIGHALTDMAASKMGMRAGSINEAATAIVKEARKLTTHKGVVQLAKPISGYATYSNAEAVAEAYSDVYCNGSKAKAESKAIVTVLNKYIKTN